MVVVVEGSRISNAHLEPNLKVLARDLQVNYLVICAIHYITCKNMGLGT